LQRLQYNYNDKQYQKFVDEVEESARKGTSLPPKRKTSLTNQMQHWKIKQRT
jgi:hypothetical protein